MAVYGVGLRAEIERLLHDTKNKLFQNYGGTGVFRLYRTLETADQSKTEVLMMEEFESALKTLGLFFTRDQMNNLVKQYGNEHKEVDYKKFVEEFGSALSDRKKSAIRQVFDILDFNHNGSIEKDDLASNFVAESMISFVDGKCNKDDALNEFLNTFDINRDGKVTYEEFETYYGHISSLVTIDDQFELVLKNTWGVELYSSKSEVESRAKFFINLTHKALVDLLKGENSDFKLNQLYASFDPHKASTLHVDEFKKMCVRLKLPQVDQKIYVRAFGFIDDDNDGGILLDEFKNFIRNGPTNC